MDPTCNGYTVMSPHNSAERAYAEWVIKASEVIAQSRMPKQPIVRRESRQFALNVPECFAFREVLTLHSKGFFQARTLLALQLGSPAGIVIEEWLFSFDSPRDLLPSARSDRKDQSLPRRLCVALRALMSLTRVVHVEECSEVTLVAREETSQDGAAMEVCRVGSSLGTINLCKKKGGGGILPSSTTPLPAQPRSLQQWAPLSVDEGFVVSHSSVASFSTPPLPRNVQTHSLGGIEMTIEPLLPRVHSGSSLVAHSPPRDLSDIWPTSNLSYSTLSPRDRAGSFDSVHSLHACIFEVPLFGESHHPKMLPTLCELPLSVAALAEQLERISRTVSPPRGY